MKIHHFPLNDRDFKITYHITNEGGNFFLCYYKSASTGQTDPLNAWRTLGVAKFTDTGKALKAWCLEMDEQYGGKAKAFQGRADSSFAAESKQEEAANEPTKMIT